MSSDRVHNYRMEYTPVHFITYSRIIFILASDPLNAIIPWNILQNRISSVMPEKRKETKHKSMQTPDEKDTYLMINMMKERKKEDVQEYIIHQFDSFEIVK